MTENPLLLTPAQLRMARAATQVSVEQIAELSGLGANTIRRLEKGDRPRGVTTSTLARLQETYENLGVHFAPDEGHGPSVSFRTPKGRS